MRDLSEVVETRGYSSQRHLRVKWDFMLMPSKLWCELKLVASIYEQEQKTKRTTNSYFKLQHLRRALTRSLSNGA